MSVYFENEWISVDDMATEVKTRREKMDASEPKETELMHDELQKQLTEMEEKESELSAMDTLLLQEYRTWQRERRKR